MPPQRPNQRTVRNERLYLQQWHSSYRWFNQSIFQLLAAPLIFVHEDGPSPFAPSLDRYEIKVSREIGDAELALVTKATCVCYYSSITENRRLSAFGIDVIWRTSDEARRFPERRVATFVRSMTGLIKVTAIKGRLIKGRRLGFLSAFFLFSSSLRDATRKITESLVYCSDDL